MLREEGDGDGGAPAAAAAEAAEDAMVNPWNFEDK
jgi:hypothetical protein